MSFPIALLRRLATVSILAGIAWAGPALAAGEPLVVYSARKYQLVDQLFQEYGRERGIEVKSVTDDGAPLIQRLTAEGATSPADVFISVDAGDLWRATEAGLLSPVKSRCSNPRSRRTCAIRQATGSDSPCARARSRTRPSA